MNDSSVSIEEEAELVDLAHRFAQKEMRPRASEYDASEEFPWTVFRKACELGLNSFDLPEACGGGGIENLSVAVRLAEELAWGDSGMSGCIGGGSFFAGPVLALGSDNQVRQWIPRVCGSDAEVAALALTEPEAGSDAAAIRTHARRSNGGYVLNGQKTWISNAPDAQLYVVFATVEPGSRARGITAFVVEKGDEGFEVGRKLPKLGTRCYPAGELFFNDCKLSEDRRLGDEGTAFRSLMAVFDRARVLLSSNSIGVGRAALEYAVDYARQRRTFGKAIFEHQAVAFRLVDAKLRLDQARLLCHHAARLADQGKPFSTEAAMAKVTASEAAFFCAWVCTQTMGSYGYSREYPAERWLRDAKLEEIYEGTSDIQRLVIARGMFQG